MSHAVQLLNARPKRMVSSESSGGSSGAQALEGVGTQLSTQTQSTMDAVTKLERNIIQ